ncbi:hypothetical protein [Haladaptatus sp. NG-SE-30]
MSTTNRNGIGRPTTDSSFRYFNRGLQVAGLFFFVNGIYVAFFSANILTTLGYYFVVVAAIFGALSQLISPDNPLISQQTQATIRQLMAEPGRRTTSNSRSRKRATKSENGFDVRRYLQAVVQKFDQIELGGSSSRRKGRDRL